jgi:hypothetical protein
MFAGDMQIWGFMWMWILPFELDGVNTTLLVPDMIFLMESFQSVWLIPAN